MLGCDHSPVGPRNLGIIGLMGEDECRGGAVAEGGAKDPVSDFPGALRSTAGRGFPRVFLQ